MLKHGGNLDEAAARYGIAREQWLDLSTGLNPQPWQSDEPVPARCYESLPYPEPAFYSTASRYYGSKHLLAVPGSQAAIQAIPRLLEPQRVAVPVPGYEEHRWHWQQNGHEVLTYDPDSVDLVAWVKQFKPRVVVVINPNNPSCTLHDGADLRALLTELESCDGLLLVDEAFLDTQPQHSLLGVESEHLIVLRSLGKFFGLPGIRVGFVHASAQWRHRLEHYLGPWAVSGPSQWLATGCLADLRWQERAIPALQAQACWQEQFLRESLAEVVGAGDDGIVGADYFVSCRMELETARMLQDFYGQRGILVRLFDLRSADLPYEALLRFGLVRGGEPKVRFESVTQEVNSLLNQKLKKTL